MCGEGWWVFFVKLLYNWVRFLTQFSKTVYFYDSEQEGALTVPSDQGGISDSIPKLTLSSQGVNCTPVFLIRGLWGIFAHFYDYGAHFHIFDQFFIIDHFRQ